MPRASQVTHTSALSFTGFKDPPRRGACQHAQHVFYSSHHQGLLACAISRQVMLAEVKHVDALPCRRGSTICFSSTVSALWSSFMDELTTS